MHLLIFLLPFLAGAILFSIVMFTEPRSLWSGFSAVCLLIGSALSILFLLVWYGHDLIENQIIYTLLLVLLIIFVSILLFFPAGLAAMFFLEGVRLIKREGFSLTNCLSIGFSLLIVFSLVLLPELNHILQNGVASWIYGVFSTTVWYGSFLLAMYTFSAWINLIHLPWRKVDQVVVLGSGIFGEKVPPLLQQRILKGIEIQKKNPGSWLILSGGQGPGEDIPEGMAMKRWALEHGANPDRTVSEENSKNTWENLEYSSKLFPLPQGRTAIVTTSYHVLRALIYSRQQHLDCIGYGSKTKWYFTLNAFLREFIAYLSLTRKRHLKVLMLLYVPYAVFAVIYLVFQIFK